MIEVIEYPFNILGNEVSEEAVDQGIVSRMKELDLKKIEPYLYSIHFDTYNTAIVENYYAENTRINPGLCSSLRKGNLFGRNLDWYYDENATFVVKTSGNTKRRAVLGVGSVSGNRIHITEAMATRMDYLGEFEYIPGMITDGINDCGVVCNGNVVPAGDKGYTLGTHPGKEPLNFFCSPRFILDNASNAYSVPGLLETRDLYAPLKINEESHIMVADKDVTLIIEFINNQMHVMSDKEGDGYDMIPGDYPIMTNFYMTDWNGEIKTGFDVPGGIREEDTTLTKGSNGTERYEILKSKYSGITDKDTMMSALKDVWYTKAYKRETTPFWYSEYCGVEGHTVYENKTEFEDLVNRNIEMFRNRKRDGKLWYTSHSCVYSILDKKLWILNNEGNTIHEFML